MQISLQTPESEYKDEYIVNDDAGEYYSTWIDIDEFKSHKKILYPENIFKYIQSYLLSWQLLFYLILFTKSKHNLIPDVKTYIWDFYLLI